jgi:uncharacterized protein YlxP (DUF503 family)
MFVGVLRLTLQIPGSRSLKDKRRVTMSLKERLQARMHVSAAEVSSLDNHRIAEIGVAVVSNEAAQCDRVLADVVAMASTHPDAILADRRSEIVPFGEAGNSLTRGIEHTMQEHYGRGPLPSVHDEETSLGGDEEATWCGDEGSDDGKGSR